MSDAQDLGKQVTDQMGNFGKKAGRRIGRKALAVASMYIKN